jgi:hypothetical protein
VLDDLSVLGDLSSCKATLLPTPAFDEQTREGRKKRGLPACRGEGSEVPGGRLGLFWPSRGQNWFVGAASPIGKTNPPLAIGYWLLAIVY